MEVLFIVIMMTHMGIRSLYQGVLSYSLCYGSAIHSDYDDTHGDKVIVSGSTSILSMLWKCYS